MVNNTHNTESSTQISKPHELRTAAEPRQDSLYRLRVSHVSQVNPTIRLIRFNVLSTCSSLDWAETDHESTLDKAEYPPFRFSPGQWLDVHIPNIRHAGGFTITSTPRDVSSQIDTDTGLPHIELAVQYSATNPAAKWFWKPAEQILNTHVKVRVGGAFVWPPPNNMPVDEIKNAIFVAGGVGINPLMSIISYIYQTRSSLLPSTKVHLLYSTRTPLKREAAPSIPTNKATPSYTDNNGNDRYNSPISQVLFLDRLQHMIHTQETKGGDVNTLDLQLFVTNLPVERGLGSEDKLTCNVQDVHGRIAIHGRRITTEDLRRVIGEDDELKRGTICYVCGPPAMTDSFVKDLQEILSEGNLGVRKKRVFSEKWW